MYRNATDFSVLVLCPAALLKSLISSNSFLFEPWDFQRAESYHLKIVTVLLRPSRFEWILVLRLASSLGQGLLDKSAESGRVSFLLILEKKLLFFSSTEYDVICGFVVYGLDYVPFISHLQRFLL